MSGFGDSDFADSLQIQPSVVFDARPVAKAPFAPCLDQEPIAEYRASRKATPMVAEGGGVKTSPP